MLAHIVRIPQIESLTPATAPTAGFTPFTLKGRSLEMIEKAGWSASEGVAPSGLPVPVPGEGQKQVLQVVLPPPTPGASLYLWLRGDKDGRETTIKPSAPTDGMQPAVPLSPGSKRSLPSGPVH